MTVNLRLPIGPFSQPIVWGHPWHGLCENGVLTLPNGATRAYQQPAMGQAAPWSAGSTDIYQRPGWTAPARSPEQAAADSSAGLQWLGYAMLSGLNRMLYGITIGGWIWCAPDGRMWRYRLAGIRTPGSTFYLTISRQRFGEIAAGSASQIVEELAGVDMQLSGAPELWCWLPDEATPRYLEDREWHSGRIMSLRRDGARAIVMWSVRHKVAGETTQLVDRAVAFSELQVQPDGTVQHVLLRGRAACVGSVTITETAGVPRPMPYIGFYGAYGTDPVSDAYSHVLHAKLVNDQSGPDDPEYLVTALAQSEPGEDTTWRAAGRAADPRLFAPRSGSWVVSLTGQIIAMWYRADGSVREITADVEGFVTRAVTHSATASGGITMTKVLGSGYVPQAGAGIDISLAFAMSHAELAKITIRENGAEVAVDSVDLQVTQSATVSTHVSYNRASDTVEMTDTASGVLRRADVIEQNFGFSKIYDESSGFWAIAGSPWSFSIRLTDKLWSILDAGRTPHFWALPLTTVRISTGEGVGGAADIGRRSLGVVRWSNHAVGTSIVKAPNGPGLTEQDYFSAGPVVTPSGVAYPTIALSTPGAALDPVCCGTWHPVSGEFVGRVAKSSDPPPLVCWV